MEHFIARQPIFDRNRKVFAYELLFRSGLHNYFDCSDQDHAATSVMANSFLLFGIEDMTGGAKAFVNCTRKVLVEDYAIALPQQHTVIEVLENVTPDEQVIAACKRLKKHGFTLALDDFVYSPEYEPLLALADIIKVDFLDTTPEERLRLVKDLKPRGITMLAEKVETQEDFEQAMEMGYQLFQGYFFSKPVILSRKDIPTSKLQFLRILKEIHSPVLDFKKLANTIQSEVSLSYKLLKLINSAAFALRYKVTSIVQSLSLLGEREIRSWVSLLSISAMADDKPAELVVSSLIRAKFCEIVAPLLRLEEQRSDLFLMGLFSQLDAIMDRPLVEILEEIKVEEQVRCALLGEECTYRSLLDLTEALEKGKWLILSAQAEKLQVDEQPLSEAYLEAVKWAQDTYNL